MVTDQQVRRLYMLIRKKKTKAAAAAAAGMDEKTARKYLRLGKLPSEMKRRHDWRTRPDPFTQDWVEVEELLKNSPGLKGKTIFEYLRKQHPGRYQNGQLRTLQRHIKRWRILHGPSQEVFFPQQHYPGRLSQSDFTSMNRLEITIRGELFDHLLYHFVLPYSNWETGTICFSESFESLAEGYQKAVWELGGVIPSHRTDRMSAAVNKECNPEKFTRQYRALLSYYGVNPERINAGRANEDGDVEQLHHRVKQAIDQALMLRGSRDFASRESYAAFLREIFKQCNAGRSKRFEEELALLKPLPARRYASVRHLSARVGPSSTIRVLHNTYSVESRLIGAWVAVRVYADHLEIWYADKKIERLPRLRGRKKHRINYRHIINQLVRKPGAFKDYRYKEDLFPTSYFRKAYDNLRNNNALRASKEYLRILQMAAWESESLVDLALREILETGKSVSAALVKVMVEEQRKPVERQDVAVLSPDIAGYDELLETAATGVSHE